jgi:hypothetical protein
MLNGNTNGFRDDAIREFLLDAIDLEPLSIFLYSWRFLATLENEEENKIVKMIYRWFARATILILPLSFYGVFAAFVIEEEKFNHSVYEGKV